MFESLGTIASYLVSIEKEKNIYIRKKYGKNEKESKEMKLIKILILLITLTFFNSYAKAEKNLDCSKYSTKSFTGLIKNIRCKKGIKPKEKEKISRFGVLNPFKARDEDGNVIPKIKKNCSELTSNNLIDMIAKLKCGKK